MLKEKLDQKVRDYRATQPPLEKQQAEMAERVKEDSNYVWEALEKVFIHNCNENKPLFVVVGICDTHIDSDRGNVYFTHSFSDHMFNDYIYKRLVSKKVKYIEETMQAICERAKREGIICEYDAYEKRTVGFFTWRAAAWYKFTYNPPKR